MLDISEVDVERGKNQRNPNGQCIQFRNPQRSQKDAPRELDSGEQTEDADDNQVDPQRNHGIHGRGDHDDVVRKMYLPQKIAMTHYGLHAHRGRLGEEIPQGDSKQKDQWEMWRAIREFEESHKHRVHDGEQHQRLEDRPCDPQKRPLVSQLEIGTNELSQDHRGISVLLVRTLRKTLHETTTLTLDNPHPARIRIRRLSHIDD